LLTVAALFASHVAGQSVATTPVAAAAVTQSPSNSPSTWDRVKITWPLFTSMPTTQQEAESAGWTSLPQSVGSESSCVSRYYYGGDISTILLYDPRGLFSGVQAGTKNAHQNGGIYPNGPFETQTKPDGSLYYTLTAYTREPSQLCSNSSDNKIGTGLWFQSGPYSASQFETIPLTETALASSPYILGKCFLTMGVHWWKNMTSTTSCNQLWPVFLLYNKGYLNAFGWSLVNMPIEEGLRWEHPFGDILKFFLPANSSQQPACLFDNFLGVPTRYLSTQHVFFTEPIGSDVLKPQDSC